MSILFALTSSSIKHANELRKVNGSSTGPTLSAIRGENLRCKRLVSIIHLANAAVMQSEVRIFATSRLQHSHLHSQLQKQFPDDNVLLTMRPFPAASFVWMIVLSSVMETGALTKAKTYVN